MLKFYICRICGNLIEMIEDSGIVPVCCGENMDELIPCSTDGAKEKHVPVCTEDSDAQDKCAPHTCMKLITVNVGSEPHPMTTDHSIEWILIQTDNRVYRKNLKPGKKPHASFCLNKKEKILAIYSYCNIHGLWVKTMD